MREFDSRLHQATCSNLGCRRPQTLRCISSHRAFPSPSQCLQAGCRTASRQHLNGQRFKRLFDLRPSNLGLIPSSFLGISVDSIGVSMPLARCFLLTRRLHKNCAPTPSYSSWSRPVSQRSEPKSLLASPSSLVEQVLPSLVHFHWHIMAQLHLLTSAFLVRLSWRSDLLFSANCLNCILSIQTTWRPIAGGGGGARPSRPAD